jgi:hypothetical protein
VVSALANAVNVLTQHIPEAAGITGS